MGCYVRDHRQFTTTKTYILTYIEAVHNHYLTFKINW